LKGSKEEIGRSEIGNWRLTIGSWEMGDRRLRHDQGRGQQERDRRGSDEEELEVGLAI
jgi:hypothetical protein